MRVAVPEIGTVRWLVAADLFVAPDSDDDGVSELRKRLRAAVGSMEIGIRLVGSATANRWRMRMRAMDLEEKRRLYAMRGEYSREQAPELWSDDVQWTPDRIEEQRTLETEILTAAISGFRGVEGYSEGEPAERSIELLRYCDLDHVVAMRAISMQSLTLAEVFCSES